VTPILKDVGRSALSTVPHIVQETVKGRPIKDTLKDVALSQGKKFLGNTLGRMMLKPVLGGDTSTFLGGTHIKRKASTASSTSTKGRKRVRRVVSHKGAAAVKGKKRKQDIFD
jgi:hypothetical protein